MLGDTHDYVAMATPVMSVQVANARVRPDVCDGIVVSTTGEKIGDLVMDGKKALNLPR